MKFNVQFKGTDQKMNVRFQNLQTVGSGGGTGKDGLSAYEIAVKNGFKGTEQEWLASLKGEPGAVGPAGADGKDGAPGRDGEDGKDGKDGKDGYTPVKGKDYFTDADKGDMVNAVIAALPVYAGEVADA